MIQFSIKPIKCKKDATNFKKNYFELTNNSKNDNFK